MRKYRRFAKWGNYVGDGFPVPFATNSVESGRETRPLQRNNIAAGDTEIIHSSLFTIHSSFSEAHIIPNLNWGIGYAEKSH